MQLLKIPPLYYDQLLACTDTDNGYPSRAAKTASTYVKLSRLFPLVLPDYTLHVVSVAVYG